MYPILSVIVPVYNVEKYLDECLTSIYAINGIEKEVIIINDGSIDKSADIIQKFSENYPLITTVIKQPNSGLSAARNAGLKMAQGVCISFVDSDDFIDPIKITKLANELLVNDLDIVYGECVYCNEKSDIIPTLSSKYYKNRLINLGITNGASFWEKRLEKDCIKVEACLQIYKRSFLLDNKLFFKEGLFHEDVLFSFLCSYYATKVKYLPLDFYYYRQREGSIMATFSEQKQIHKLFIANYLQDFKEKHSISLYSWDSIIVSLYFDVLRHSKIMNRNLYHKIVRNKKMTIRVRMKSFLIPLLQLNAKDVDITL